ncbi:TPA: hypothetical protein ACXJRF_001401 [Serratia marcescens]|uniref:hypothetical protein n=1 Tax=Serratia marcescens TaxID=615 RepID=UPI00124A6D18|nr:hypothetical protein [Serratia marcescens]KAB1581263.1 hypothetical protein F7687_08530 [Serratia marcescens]
MQSSRNTTEIPTGEQLYAELSRKIKKSSANITKRKLDTGEYVMRQGRVVPANVVEELEAEAAEQRQGYTNIAAGRHLGYVPARLLRTARIEAKGLNSLLWKGSRKSVTATSVETSIRHPMRVRGAAPIRQFSTQVEPKDGQLFSFDAKSGQMLPIEEQRHVAGLTRRSRRARLQQQAMVNVNFKAK